MKRREVLSILGGAAVAFPLAARAQARAPIRIGFLPLGSPSNTYDRSLVEAFRQGLRQVGLVENRDVVLDVGWISGDPDQAVIQLLQRGAELLVTCGTVASMAAHRQAPSAPVIFISVGNPVGVGLVENLSRPGGHATGFSDILADVSGKLVELARELSPPQGTVGYIWHTEWADGRHRLQASEQAAQTLGVKLLTRGMADIIEVNGAMTAMKENGAITLIIQPSPFTYQQRERLIAAAADHGLATIFAFPPAARDGALIAYGPDYLHMYLRAPFYVDRVLKGAKPADLPVEEPAKLELIVNLKIAKALGVEVPLDLIIRADELIE